MEKFKKKFKAYHIYRLIHDTLHYSPKQCNRNPVSYTHLDVYKRQHKRRQTGDDLRAYGGVIFFQMKELFH